MTWTERAAPAELARLVEGLRTLEVLVLSSRSVTREVIMTRTRGLSSVPRAANEGRPRSLAAAARFARQGTVPIAALVLACIAGSAPSPAVPAGENGASATSLQTRLTSVALFKNGLGFVTREAVLPKGQGPWVIEGLPAPVHGTFWVHAPDHGVTVKDLVAFPKDRVVRMDAVSVAELLEANVGQTVDLRISEKETVHGRILSVPADRARTPDPLEPVPGPYAYGYPPGSTVEPASLVLVQTGEGTPAVSKSAVQQIASPGAPLKTTFDRRTRGAALRLRTSVSEDKERVVVQYLARGITWAPSCAIDITDPQKARVTTKATIVDEIEDLDETPVRFVTGYPNLQFADATDPL